MVEKFKDAANILRAKLKKDDLEQSLVQATSEQNWQTPTTLLHQIANASYNYQKCQQINDFIWDKLKKKTSWRKILKTLNLVQFLLKNGPPSVVSNYKHDVYQFKSLWDYSHVSSQGIDRGEAIRQRSKIIVQLLTNQQILEQQRTKAKTIRQKMSGMTGGGYSGATQYQGYDSKNYNNKSTNQRNYGGGSGSGSGNGGTTLNTAYGDYTYNKSTLDKYKDKQKPKQKQDKKLTKPSITGYYQPEIQKPDITQQQPQQIKKPFEKQAPKLGKPGQKPMGPSIVQQQPDITGTGTGSGQNVKKQAVVVKNSLMDDDIFGFSQPVKQAPVVNQPQTVNTAITQPAFINPMYGTTAPLAAQTTQQQQQYINPMYSTTGSIAAQNISQTQQQQYINPMYGTTAPLANQNMQANINYMNPMYGATNTNTQANQFNYINPMYGTTQTMAANNYQQQQQQQAQMQQNWSYNQPQQNAYMINPMYSQTAPMAVQQQQITTQNISLSSTTTTNNNQFGNFQSSTTTTNNLGWLSDKEKGLIDFSDFATASKPASTVSTKQSSSVAFQW